MSITGMVKAGSRSKSTSPPVNTQHSINVSTSRDHRPHILVFDINFNLISPRVHEQKSLLIDGQWNDHIRVPISFSEPNSANSSTKSAGQPDSGASRQQNSNGLPKNRFRQEVYSNKSLDIITINTPKSISDTSNVSRENPEQMRVLMKAANAITVNARIVDSRSKTLNVVPPPSIESLRGNNAYIRTKPSAGRTVVKADSKYRNRREASPNKPVDRLGTSSPTGYGKPLLTCVTKKLIVMKDTPKPMTDIKEIRPVTVRNRSPLRSWRKEQNPSVSSISGKKTDKIEPFTHPKLEMATSVLFHLIFWRLAYLAKCLVSLEWLIPSSIIAVGILFWTAKTGTAGNLLRTVNTVGRNKPDEKLTVQRGAPPAKQIRGSSTSVRNRSPCRTGKPENKQDPLRAKPIKPPLQNDPKSWTSDFNNSPTRQINRNRCSAPAVNKLAQDIKGSSTSVSRNKSPCRSGKPDSKQDASNSKSPTRQPNRNRCSATAIAKTVQDTNKNERKNPSSPTFSKPSPTGTRVVNTEHKIERPIPDHMKVILNNPYNKDLSMSMISGIYNKSFKPQLEDIKSSFMLLNKKQEQIRQNEKGKEESITDLKSSGFDEETRREQLAEIKKKFKSKHFWNDSKYDKIEGLNWISWK